MLWQSLPLVASLRNQDCQFEERTAAGVWRWTTRMDVSGASPTYTIHSIITPWGLFRDSLPIPGDIMLKMASSITELMNAYSPSIILGPPSTLLFEVDEGWGFTPAQKVLLSNGGTFGSLLNVSLATSAPYLVANPPNVGGIAMSSTGSFEVTVDSTDLKAINSPIAGTVIIQDPRANNTPQVLPVAIVVRPKAIIDLSAALLEFHVVAPLSGQDYPVIPIQGFQLRNTGPGTSVLDYQIQRLTGCSPWLAAFSPPVGTVSGLLQQFITVLVQPPCNTGRGTFEETLRVSGYSENLHEDILVRLVVS